jgi:transposase
METRRKFTKEFKREALALVASSGKSASQVAGDLGIIPGLLQRWQREVREENEGKTAFTGQGKARDEEMARLARENKDLRETNEILKKAVAIFSTHKTQR